MIAIALPMAWFVKENPEGATTTTKKEEPKKPFMNILKGWPFYLLLIGSMCSIGAVSGTSQNLKLFMSIDLNYSQQQAANVLSVVLGSSIIGRLLMGWLADKIQKKYVMIIIYALVALSIPLLFASHSEGVMYLFAFIFGMALGGDYMIIPLMAGELFGVHVLGRVMGIILTADGVAEATAPMFVGYLRDSTGSYNDGFYTLIGVAVLGAIAIVLLPSGGRSISVRAGQLTGMQQKPAPSAVSGPH